VARAPGGRTASRGRLRRVATLAAVAVVAAGCGDGPLHATGGRSAQPPTSAAPTPYRSSSPASPSPAAVGSAPSRHSPSELLVARGEARGAQPQTATRPVQDAVFRARVAALWSAVSSGDPRKAQAFFFPLSAYRQVKAIRDPAADWRDRLVRLYRLDLRALAATVPVGSALLGADVPTTAVLVPPGAESNALGYWRVYGTRVRYRTPGGRGQVRSFGVCSMISWRGEWYGVHLGPVQRSGAGGELCP